MTHLQQIGMRLKITPLQVSTTVLDRHRVPSLPRFHMPHTPFATTFPHATHIPFAATFPSAVASNKLLSFIAPGLSVLHELRCRTATNCYGLRYAGSTAMHRRRVLIRYHCSRSPSRRPPCPNTRSSRRCRAVGVFRPYAALHTSTAEKSAQ